MNKKKTYLTPQMKTVECNVQSLICVSPYGNLTEGFTINQTVVYNDWVDEE